jgi:rhomboid protease GluP
MAEAYTVSSDENKVDVLYMIKERGIYYWDENIILIKELDQLYPPKTFNDQIRSSLYQNLRKSIPTWLQKINENTSVYDQIGSLNYQIEGLLKTDRKNQRINPVNHFHFYSKKCIFATYENTRYSIDTVIVATPKLPSSRTEVLTEMLWAQH